jgi:hypothetical protein
MDYQRFYEVMGSAGLPNGDLSRGMGHPELLRLYEKWKEDVFTVEHPSYFSKCVHFYFVYQGVQYTLEPWEFDQHVKHSGREPYEKGSYVSLVDGARAELLFLDYVQKDLKALGLSENDMILTGTID